MSSFIFIGPPGAGKGTQREMFFKKYNVGSIVPGDLMREEIKNKTKVGFILEGYLNKGLLAPHEIVMNIVEEKIKHYVEMGVRDIIFDGFPREIEQSNALDNLLTKYNEYTIKCVFLFKVKDDEVVARIHHRGETSCRVDDKSDEVITKRLDVYYSKIVEVVNKYKNRNILYEIDGNSDVETVFEKIDSVIHSFLNNNVFKKI